MGDAGYKDDMVKDKSGLLFTDKLNRLEEIGKIQDKRIDEIYNIANKLYSFDRPQRGISGISGYPGGDRKEDGIVIEDFLFSLTRLEEGFENNNKRLATIINHLNQII